jgi:hypothetical protein
MLWDERLAERASSKSSVPPNPPDKRYAMHMRLTALQIRYRAGPQKQHYALAPELMALYADKINKLAQTSTDRETIHEIEFLISQGALLRGAAVRR